LALRDTGAKEFSILLGALIVLPVLTGYTVFAYRVFRGKAQAGLYGK
jgi:cytochrome bd-type quinol oxidase subunit 2